MSYGEIVRVGAPIEAYQAMHQQIRELLGAHVPDGAILHVARATDDGFEVIEVWESKEQADAFKREVYQLAVERLGAGAAGTEPQFLEFEPTTTVTFAAYNSDTQRYPPAPAGDPLRPRRRPGALGHTRIAADDGVP